MANVNPTDIAVIGISGRFPGARNVSEYWRNLCNGTESVTFLSEEQLRQSGVPAELIHDADYVRAAYLLEDADRFDASFFGYAPREARFIDPQQRVLLQCAWQAMEHAGYGGGSQRTTGVYVGSSLNTYVLFTGLAEQFKTEPVLTLMSNDKDFLATRIGYKLELEGPCLTVQTACSTSLVAVHVACQSILSGECEMALAGGVCVKVPLLSGYVYREGGMLSRDGHCRAFDAKATGTIFGSGAGLVVLKKYTDALADGDTVHAVIKGTAINNDGGRKASYTAPSVNGLAEVIGQAMDFGQVKAEAISYVECHGTGTALGDPIEVHALTKAFRASTNKEHFSALASVKSNVGHLEAASGVAGLIKAICCLKHQYLPATLHFESPNPALGLAGSPFFVNAEGRNWAASEEPRTAAVNSLGVGGTNANVILQEAPPGETTRSTRRWHWFPVSAKSAASLATAREEIVTCLNDNPQLDAGDAAYTLLEGRSHQNHRDVIFVDAERRDTTLTGSTAPATTARPRPVVFLLGDGFDEEVRQALLCQEPAFARLVDQSTEAGTGELGALALLWERWGVVPQAYLGEGSGASMAARIAGIAHGGVSRQQIALATAGTELEVYPLSEEQADKLCRMVLDRFPNGVFVPIGSAGLVTATLQTLIGQSTAQVLLPSLAEATTGDSIPALLQQAALLWKLGVSIDGAGFFSEECRRRIPLPTYPFRGERHWWAAAEVSHPKARTGVSHSDALAKFVTQSRAVSTMSGEMPNDSSMHATSAARSGSLLT